jgi:hypothetical protein
MSASRAVVGIVETPFAAVGRNAGYRPGTSLGTGLELEGRDVDGRVGTCPDGILLVPSACPGQGMEMHWVHGDQRATTGWSGAPAAGGRGTEGDSV